AEPASGSGYGIMLEDSDDNLLRNCTVSSFGYYGIYLYNSARDNTILDSSADSNGDAGLMLEVAYNTVVRNSSFSGSPNGSGLIVTSATGVALDNLTVADNGDETSDYGLSVSSSSQITLKFSSFSNNSGIGTYIYNSNNIVIYSNRMVDHQSHTLQLWTVNDALVARNILESGSGDVVSAVSLYYTTDTWIENNSVTQQGDGPEDSGIGLRYSYGNTIYNNSIGDSDATGIRLRDESNSNFVLDNHLLRLKGYGIQVSDGNRPSLYNLVSGNILEEIDQYALYVATKGAWNTFSGNAISDSEAQGIGVFGADNTFSGNSISGGLAAAIIDDGQRNSFTGNSIDATGQTAIIVYASGGTYSNNSITNGLEGFWISGSDNHFVNETVVVSSTALKFVNGDNNIFRESSLSGDVTLESGSTGNRLNATSLQGSISCDSSSQLFIADNIVVEALNADLGTPFTGVHLRFKADGEVVYATPHFNGSDETTGADGRIAPQMLVHTSYDGSSDPESTEFSLAYAFHLRENTTQFSASGPHLETVLVPDIWNYGLVQNLQTGEEYVLISAAVEDATAGDELLVWPSLYVESVSVSKRLTITGFGPGVRVQGDDAAFNIWGNGVVLQDISISNSNFGVVVMADNVTLANLTISNTTDTNVLLINQTGARLENVTASSLKIEGAGDHILRHSDITFIQLSGSTTGNRALDTTFGTVDCQLGSSLAIEYRLTVELRTVKGNGSGLDVELLEGGAVFYATSAFGGSDARSDGAGRLPEQVVAGLLYNGSSTPEQVLTTVRVEFNGLQESSFIVSQDSLERVWLNLPPQVSIKGVSPSPAIRGDLQQPVDGATLAWWPLDEGSGTTSADGSGNGHNLTLGPTPSWAAGHDGSAVLFDGQYIYLEGPRLSLTTMTIELWFNTIGSNGTLLSDKGGGTTWNHHIYLLDGEPRFEHTQNLGGTVFSLAAGTQFNDGSWHHLAVVRSHVETSLWVDGALRASSPSATPDLSPHDTWLGMSPDGSNAYAGMLDSVRLSSVARHSGDFLIGSGTVILLGQASDSDGSVTNWSWYSSQDGLLGHGARLEIAVDSLSIG
ncbi:MAG: hypothetical protein DSY84_09350, partial [Candidatus Neomarinimicrobiota bacterium]